MRRSWRKEGGTDSDGHEKVGMVRHEMKQKTSDQSWNILFMAPRI